MKSSPKQALVIVVAIVLTGEALAAFLADHAGVIIGGAAAIFSGVLIYSIRTANRRNP